MSTKRPSPVASASAGAFERHRPSRPEHLSSPAPRFGWLGARVGWFALLAALTGCNATLGAEDGVAPSDELPGGEAASCLAAAQPRRVLRLGAGEILAAARAVAPFDDDELPLQLVRLAGTERTDAKLAVTKELHQAADALATALSQKLATRLDECAEFGSDTACTESVLAGLEQDLLRSRQDAEAHASLLALLQGVSSRSGPAKAFEMAVRALALSPKSLYLSEGVVAPDGDLTGQETAMRGKELASFVSFRLVGQPPSSSFVEAVGTGSLNASELEELIGEHFGREGFAALTLEFLEGWLRVREIGQLSRPADKHPEVDGEFLAALETETRETLGAMANASELDLRTLLTAPQTSVLLGDSGEAGSRPGVFSLPGVVATVSSNNNTNIPRRGRFILKSLLCRELPNPPPGAVDETPPLREGASQRERFEGVEAKGGCAGCHTVLDPLAFPFEVFDEVGRVRTEDEHGNVLDTTGSHETGDGALLEYANVTELMALLAEEPSVNACVTRRISEYLARRELSDAEKDSCLIGVETPLDLHGAVRSLLMRAATLPRGN